MLNRNRLRATVAATLLSLTMITGFGLSSMAAPLYKETLAIAGVFPGVSYQDALINRAKALGFTRCRIDLDWESIERTKGVYDWSFYDNVYNKMKAAGLQAPVFILDYNNKFYGPSTNHPQGYKWGITTQSNRDAFARFANAAVNHYKGRGIIWEVWNEQDVQPFWADTPSPTAYAALAQASVNAIRQAEPGAYVITGGFAKKYDQKEFIRQTLAAGALKGYNALAVHSYDVLNPPRKLEMQESLHDEFRSWMNQYNGGNVLPIVDTEFGMSTFWGSQVNSANPNDARAKRYIRMYLDNYHNKVFMSSVFGLNDTQNGQLGDFNLYNDSPMSRALTYTNKLLAEYEGTNMNLPSTVRGIDFKTRTTSPTDPCNPTGTGQKRILALWSANGDQSGNLPASIKVSGIYDVYGNQVMGAGTVSTYKLSESTGPVFLVQAP